VSLAVRGCHHPAPVCHTGEVRRPLPSNTFAQQYLRQRESTHPCCARLSLAVRGCHHPAPMSSIRARSGDLRPAIPSPSESQHTPAVRGCLTPHQCHPYGRGQETFAQQYLHPAIPLPSETEASCFDCRKTVSYTIANPNLKDI